MGKRKIGEIYNRPIIEGDINLKTSSEIHKSELNVPQSGGESGGGDAPSGGSGMLYFDCSSVPDNKRPQIAEFALMGQVVKRDDGSFWPPAMYVITNGIDAFASGLSAFGISPMLGDIQPFGGPFTEEKIIELIQNVEILTSTSIPRITEEEFYNLEA